MCLLETAASLKRTLSLSLGFHSAYVLEILYPVGLLLFLNNLLIRYVWFPFQNSYQNSEMSPVTHSLFGLQHSLKYGMLVFTCLFQFLVGVDITYMCLYKRRAMRDIRMPPVHSYAALSSTFGARLSYSRLQGWERELGFCERPSVRCQ